MCLLSFSHLETELNSGFNLFIGLSLVVKNAEGPQEMKFWILSAYSMQKMSCYSPVRSLMYGLHRPPSCSELLLEILTFSNRTFCALF